MTYGIGVTTSGVQAFRYRGERELCVPGQMHILHPDETHDGTAATAAGFGYRIIYADPDLISAALGRRPLPFVPRPVHDHPPVHLLALLDDIDEPIRRPAGHFRRARTARRSRPLRHCPPVPRAYGTSPERYRIFRRLDLARAAMRAGTPLARAATDAGFADQSHFTRQFKRAYGLTPGRWATLSRWP